MATAETAPQPDFNSSNMSGTTATEDPVTNTEDPFAAQRSSGDDPFANQREGDSLAPPESLSRDRRMSKEWDASKVPPSQFQRRKGSVFSTPSSRDSHTSKGKERDQGYHDKLKEKGWVSKLTGK